MPKAGRENPRFLQFAGNGAGPCVGAGRRRSAAAGPAAWQATAGRPSGERRPELDRQNHRKWPGWGEKQPAATHPEVGRGLPPARDVWGTARGLFRAAAAGAPGAAHRDTKTAVPLFFRFRRCLPESRCGASSCALYAIGPAMELLVLTVFGDVSILPPLLNLSPNLPSPVFHNWPHDHRRQSACAQRSLTTMGHARRQFLCWMLTFAVDGCQRLMLRSQNPDEEEIKLPETRFIRDQVTVSGLHPITIESVGLITNLDNTGGDPPPSMYRSLLVNDMKKRGVPNPNTLLQSPTSALVLIRAAVPPVIDVGDTFDVEVVLPENTEATSLKGGWLMEAHLSEQAMVPGGQPHAGHSLATAQGPIMLSTGEGDSDSTASVLKRGRILGGAKYIGGLTRKG